MNLYKKIKANKYTGFVLAPLFSSIIALLTIPMTTWLVSPEEYGKTAVFFIFHLLVNSIIYLGMDHSYVRTYHEIEEKNILFYRAIIVPLIFALIISSILILFNHKVSFILFNEKTWIVYILSLWIPLLVIERFILLKIRMEEKGNKYGKFSIGIKLSVFLFTFFMLVLFGGNFKVVILATILGQIVVDCILVISTYREKSNLSSLKINYDVKDIISMLKYGLPFIPFSLVLWLLNSTDRFILSIFESPGMVGEYLIALKIVGLLLVFQTIFTTIWVPIAFKWYQRNESVKKYDLINYIIFVSMGLLYLIILNLKPLIPLVLSDQYQLVVLYLPFLLLYPLFYTVSEATGLGIAFKKKSILNLWISLIAAIVNVGLCYFLIKEFSVVGASIAIGCSYFTYFTVKTIISRKIWFKFKTKYMYIFCLFFFTTALLNLLLPLKLGAWMNIILLVLYVIVNFNKFKSSLIVFKSI
ncbi:lipopolysaccharide biosynthesis protein [Exiguobacterium alkaliphilum]|uniref:lipopolysaccharide biosynthesis protein n=1 Tax=Exiguobacterium alkaliphilum TaxID=1428684 RepID=UPI0034647520